MENILIEDIFHETPPREGGLEKVEPHKGSEEIPVGAYKIAKP
jgi:hypothetical protein